MTNSRASGRTFRLLLKALHHMSDGGTAVVVCKTQEAARSTFITALEMTESYTGSRALSIDAKSCSFKVNGTKGEINFVSAEGFLRWCEQRKGFKLFQDNWK